MTLDDLKSHHSALLAARYSGTRSVSYDGKTLTYGTDAELAPPSSTSNGASQRPSAALGGSLAPHAVKDL